jgi:hypothetical protein
VVHAGSTTVRVYAPEHPVPTAVRIQKANPAFLFITRALNVWVFFALAVAGVVGWTYATVWSDDAATTLSAAGGAAALVIAVWSALWSAAGRLIRRRAYFRAHVSMISIYLALGALIAWITSALDFLLSENTISLVAGYLLNGALLALLIYGSLSVATLMKKRKRMTAALTNAGALVVLLIAFSFARAGKFSPDPAYPYVIMPYLDRLAVARAPDAFMDKSAKIFSSGVFDKKTDKDEKTEPADKTADKK